MSEHNNTKAAMDVAEIALATTGAIVSGPVGAAIGVAGVIANKMIGPLQRYRRSREEKFLTLVAGYMSANDPDGAADFVAQHVETDEFADVLDRGYEKMRRAFHPLAEECICLLVADHLRSASSSDQHFISTANLLETSNKEMLITLNAICDGYFASSGPGLRVVIFDSSKVPESIGPFFFAAAYDGDDVAHVSDNVAAPPNLHSVLTQLASHGFGMTWRGLGMSAPESRGEGHPSCRHHFLVSDYSSVLTLHRSLAPVRRDSALSKFWSRQDQVRRG